MAGRSRRRRAARPSGRGPANGPRRATPHGRLPVLRGHVRPRPPGTAGRFRRGPVRSAGHRPRRPHGPRGLRRREPGLLRAPHAAFLFVTGDGGPRLAADAGAYLQTLLLAMAAYGVASCPQGLLSFYADTVRDELGVDEGKCSWGSPSVTPTRTRR
nr:nitroreductase family protein [Streptomyces sp. alain-838]